MIEIVVGMIVTAVFLMAIYNAAKIRKLESDINTLMDAVEPLQAEYIERMEEDKQKQITIREGQLQLVNDTEGIPEGGYYGTNEKGELGYGKLENGKYSPENFTVIDNESNQKEKGDKP